jgi:hypothetical protein
LRPPANARYDEHRRRIDEGFLLEACTKDVAPRIAAGDPLQRVGLGPITEKTLLRCNMELERKKPPCGRRRPIALLAGDPLCRPEEL